MKRASKPDPGAGTGTSKPAFDLELPRAIDGEATLPPPKCPDFATYVAWLDAERRRLIDTDPELFERLRNRPLPEGRRFNLAEFDG